jgi:glutaredoxin-like protein NrdH
VSGDAGYEIVVYTQPHCASCRQVERYLQARTLAFTVRDVFDDPAALDEITSRGYMSTPVTRIGGRWIAGFREREFERALAGLPE